ncbi:hypothetical protein N7510_000660 [Penicillium lagena]|uniref:uncharacterized protein n=1 Tax=Penicillium lagena TaxID=94218 RepID=UPI002540B8E3|nr:uncharacterized protein N7510_000660 [Penicillium lagena]KAJ5624351.1 hypothetical protein N7510_000660 [Penicillium lagena]
MQSYGCFYRLLGENGPVKSYLPQHWNDHHPDLPESIFNTEAIPELFYSFPLYDGASIVGFTCHVGNAVIRGQVKPKKKAEEVYQKAKSRGQTAAIFDQSYDAADIFKTRLGNLPAGGKTDGIRYTVPITIAPRYGTQNNDQTPRAFEGIAIKTAIKVDMVMERGFDIRNILSPTHPIEVNIGRTSTMPETAFKSCCASVKLRENVVIQEDFVATVGLSKQDLPFAFLETHPRLPNQRALMVSLIPKFGLPQSASEIILLIDRSGSMEDKIPTLRSALEVFLKSLPIGIHFNIVSFGSESTSLWPRSKICYRGNLEEALKYTKKIKADMAMKEISARFFTLGIGNTVSHSLIGGISRAGMGFSQSVQNYEELDKTVVRMLKGALMARVTDAILNMNLLDIEGEDFVAVELIKEHTKEGLAEGTKKPIELFDDKYEESDNSPLFPFIRSTIYVLLSGEISSFPETISLRAKSDHSPLELDIPVQDIGHGETIHQLAAKRAMGELDEGHGDEDESDEDMGFGLFDGPSEEDTADEENSVLRPAMKICRKAAAPDSEGEAGSDEDDKEMLKSHSMDGSSALHMLISMQTFDGYWDWYNELLQALGLEPESAKAKLQTHYKALTGKNSDIWSLTVWKKVLVTCLVGHFLQTQLSDSKDVWEFLKERRIFGCRNL